ncbi:MAG: type II toxin-antitoxin system HicA family toxin [Anaerolineae bacterium]|nr:type II toxin-antitoxin system HicA family toxin [Anaerolineae bacterium]MCB9132340.1 type II toxin-antitoxin system HicA family toxin [Anaerolineales bacterium]MCB0228754.1 type II toxin-antitoxin system HicA family toxin [Anaerolineae bacterium]MCB0235984.1 type II toxin-antitoxin system HicA family toxin [Anaerolineae bacterium]MCB0240289.1 type II toxin-antitoxin system HicA family toxin [Anaerolineae bacterium]
MPDRLLPVTRTELIRRLRRLGFDGPYSGGRHEFMLHDTRRLILPNPHRHDISPSLLTRLLKQAGVTRTDWDASA